jgi:hypothetical protein
MVSAGGLNLSTDRWHDSIEFFEDEIMQAWRFALTDYLRASIRKRLYVPDLPLSSEQTVAAQARRPWNVKITKAMSKWRFVNYAGRYIRRLPISQQRILSASDTEIAFQSKDTRASKSAGYTVWIEQRCTPAKFIDFALTASSRSLSTFNAILRFAGTTHERMQFESFTVGLEPARTQGAPATTLSDIDSPAVWLRSASRLARKPNALDEIYTPAASSRLEKSLRYLSQ